MNKTFEEPTKPAALTLPGSESLICRTNNIDWQACDESGFWVKPLIEDDSKKEYFVHVSGLIDEIKENDTVEFELQEGKKGLNAANVKVC